MKLYIVMEEDDGPYCGGYTKSIWDSEDKAKSEIIRLLNGEKYDKYYIDEVELNKPFENN